MRTRFGIAAGVVTFSILVAGPVMAAGKSYTAADVAKHRTTASCWTIIGSSVYDLTSFIPQHPGGKGAVTSLCGKNGTAAFNGQHGGARTPKATLSRYRIGALEASAAGAAASSSGAGVSGAITAGQVATHDRASDCWTSIDGRVYDLTSFVARHPGGSARIISLCGTDGTAAFAGQHAGSGAAMRALAAYQIGGTGSVARPSASTGPTGTDDDDDDQGEDGDHDDDHHGGQHDEDD